MLVFDIGGGSTELVWIDLSEVAPERRAQAIVNLQMNGGAGGPGAARIVDFISVPLGVATLHERYADVADDSARFALMSWFFEEQIAGFKPYLETLRRGAGGVPDDRDLGHGDHRRGGAPRAAALRPAQGRRHAAVGAGDRRR